MKLSGKRFILLLLYAPTNGNTVNIPIAGRTRLMKMGFLFKEEIKSNFEKDETFEEIALPEYVAWKYGPFSGELLNDLEFLVNQNYIKTTSGNATITAAIAEAQFGEYDYWVDNVDEFRSREYDEETFELTETKGVAKAKEIWEILTENQKRIISEFKKILNHASLTRILEYVYKKYQKQGYVDKSLIRERYLV